MEKVEQKPLDKIDEDRLILGLELKNTSYQRLSQFGSINDSQKKTIPPTKFDEIFRKKWIQEKVHDENTWTMDGVSAHATIF